MKGTLTGAEDGRLLLVLAVTLASVWLGLGCGEGTFRDGWWENETRYRDNLDVSTG
jgi:hypothetical protein